MKGKMTWPEWAFFAMLILFALTASGCATPEHYAAERDRLAAWERVEVARANADARRFDVMGRAADGADPATRLAIALAIGFRAGSMSDGFARTPVPALTDPNETALRWASIIAPTVTQLAAVGFGAKVAINGSDNARMQAEASYGAMAQLGTAGLSGVQAVAVRGFDAFAALPPGTVTTWNVGAGGVANTGAGSATLDNSRRCAPTYTQAGGVPAGTGAALAPWSFANPFNC